MAVQEYRRDGAPATATLRRLSRARPVLLTVAVLFIALFQVAGLGAVPALIGFVVVACAVLIREANLPDTGEAARNADHLMPAIVDRAVEAVVSDLPHPTIVLTPESIVVAFNESTQEVTPAILRGEPISFALRVPNVLEAIRGVAASSEMRRIEFPQRVPTGGGKPRSRRWSCRAELLPIATSSCWPYAT